MADKVLIFDSTPRDGEQSRGVALTADDKVEIAQQLEKLGVDIIEAGFPLPAQGALEAGAAAAPERDAARDALKEAARPRIHGFLPVSDIRLMHQLRKARDTVLEMAGTQVARAKQ